MAEESSENRLRFEHLPYPTPNKTMITTNPSAAAFCRRLAIALSLLSAVHLYGQATSAPLSPATLASYDKNKNGKLDPEELAQKKRDEEKSGAVVLTPFQVSTSKDRGYAAGNTLSGGRVDTPLEITPGSISVMTKEFMNDFNVTNMNDAGGWMIGVELGTPVPNSNPNGTSVYQNIIRGASPNNNFPTRDGVINFGAADAYNTERFEFQRGPDTSMFGDGGPGGRQGSQSKKAEFNRSSTELSVQGDSWNGFRHTLDYSKGFERWGVRLDALYTDAPGYAAGTNKTKKAWTLATNAQLTKNTTVSASYERMNEWNNLWSITNGDAQAAWDSTTINEDNSALLGNVNADLNARGLERMTVAQNGSASNMFVYNFGTHDMQDYGGNQYRTRGIGFLGPNLRIPYTGNPYLLAIPSRRAPIPRMDPKFSAAARDNFAARDSDTMSVKIEHRIGNLFLLLGYTKNDFDNNTIWSNTSPNAYIIDVNKVLPNGRLNPKFLHPFTDVEQNNIYSQDAIQSYQGIATYKFTVPKWWDYKQQLSLTTEHRNTQSEGATRAWRRIDNPVQPDPYNSANRFFYRVYWDEPKAQLSTILTDPNKIGYGKWAYVEGGGGALNGGDGITLRKLDHVALISQSAFLNEKVSFTGSYSQDKVGVDYQGRVNSPTLLAGSTGAAGGYKNVLGVNNIPGSHYIRNVSVHSASAGTVIYPFQFKNEGVLKTFLSPLGFVFNFAENTEPPSSSNPAPLIDGTAPPLTHARTKDYGLRYSIPGGKAYLTLSHYNTSQIDNGTGFGSATDITNIWINLGYTDPKLTNTGTGNFRYSDPSSKKLEGWEAELTANPTRNITMLINYSHPLVYTVKDSVARKAYVAAHRAEWEAGAKAAQGQVINGKTILDPTIIQNSLTAIDNSLAGITSGVLEDANAVHRINVAGAYSFLDGALKGLRLNAGVRYRSHTKSGSRDARLKFGLPDSATPTTLQNTQAAWDYLWTPSYWKHTITVGANYTYRIGKQSWRFQLNVVNPLNELHPLFGNSGLGAAYTTVGTNVLNAGNARTQFLYAFVNPDPRKFTFSTTVSF